MAIDPSFAPALCDRHRLSPAICAALPRRFSNALKTYFESSNGGEVTQAPYRGKAAHHLHIGDQVGARALGCIALRVCRSEYVFFNLKLFHSV